MINIEGLKILYAEDDATLRELVTEMLEDEGAKVVSVFNGSEAFELLTKQVFDIIISDVRMPGGDGHELLKNVKDKLDNPPPLIFLTGFSDLEEESNAIKLGAHGLLDKPFILEKLIEKITSVLT